ncbi:FAGR219Wp [Eremothecium gossypii FDAG1]|nr:FAGR219Wp [Eremothecium gossypii FDAG1]
MVSAENVAEWKRLRKIGIIGMGAMGQLYAERFSAAGWQVLCCDRSERYAELVAKYADSALTILQNGYLVSRECDYIIYSVEAANIGAIVAQYGPSTKLGAIVGGQTSCKSGELQAFEQHLPADVDIVTVHSLHGPKVDPEGQPLVLIDHRTSRPDSFPFVEALMSCLRSRHVYITGEEHDQITADTQAITHAAFLSMGLAWYKRQVYPWDAGAGKWCGGLENAKMNISLRIYSNKWHVYAGLAITNPTAHCHVTVYAQSATDLFTLMIEHRKDTLRDRLLAAKAAVFRHRRGNLLLDDAMLDRFSLSKAPLPPGSTPPPNSHLSLLAIVDSWHRLGIDPYDHMLCSTPLFRIFLGVSEYLFLAPGLLERTIVHAVDDSTFRADDLEFVAAARSWSQLISFGNFDLYRRQFEEVQRFFEPMFPDATRIGNAMIRTILAHDPGA